MNKMLIFRYISGVICILLGSAVFFVQTDRHFIDLTPGEGAGLLQTIRSDTAYEQNFIAQGQVISKIGVYFLPVSTEAKTSSGNITLSLFSGENKKATADIPVSLIDSNGASFVRMLVPSTKGEVFTIQVMASSDASGLIALKKRPFDETFSQNDVLFRINKVQQEYAMAHSVFERIWPPFVQQFGGIFVIAGFILLFWAKVRNAKNAIAIVILVCVAVLYAIPSFPAYPLFLPIVAFLLIASFLLFRVTGRATAAAAFGACIFACSTWLPLYSITGGTVEGILSVSDALIDPNQISVSHGAGGYVGFPGALFGFIGIIIWLVMVARRRFTATHIDSVVAIMFAASYFITFIPSPIHHYRAIIVVVFCIAWFASLAFDKMQRFLGLRDIFSQTLLIVLLAIFLLDLMNITARTFAYGLGI